jgi:hypothetical protein
MHRSKGKFIIRHPDINDKVLTKKAHGFLKVHLHVTLKERSYATEGSPTATCGDPSLPLVAQDDMIPD